MKTIALQIDTLKRRLSALPKNSRKRPVLERELTQLLTRQLRSEIKADRRAA